MRGCSGLGYILDPLRGEIANTQLIARSGHRRRFGMLRPGKSFFASAGIGAASLGMPPNVPAGLSAPAGASQHPSLAASADDPDPAPRHAFAAAERTDARARSTRSGVARRSRRTARRRGTRRVSWGPLPAAIFGVSHFRRHDRERPVLAASAADGAAAPPPCLAEMAEISGGWGAGDGGVRAVRDAGGDGLDRQHGDGVERGEWGGGAHARGARARTDLAELLGGRTADRERRERRAGRAVVRGDVAEERSEGRGRVRAKRRTSGMSREASVEVVRRRGASGSKPRRGRGVTTTGREETHSSRNEVHNANAVVWGPV